MMISRMTIIANSRIILISVNKKVINRYMGINIFKMRLNCKRVIAKRTSYNVKVSRTNSSRHICVNY